MTRYDPQAMKLNSTSSTQLLLWPRKTIHKSWTTGEKHLHKRYSYENDIMQEHRIESCFLLMCFGNAACRISAGLFCPAHLLESCLSHYFSYQESLPECHSFQYSWKQVQGRGKRLQPDAGSCVLLLFHAHGDSLGIVSSSNCWGTTGKDILLTSIYSSSGWRGRLSQHGQNEVLPLAENSHTGSKLHLSSALRMGKQQRRNVQLQL